MEGVHIQMEGHLVPMKDRLGYSESALSMLSLPGARTWWTRHRVRFNPSFAAWVSAELDKRPETNDLAEDIS